MEGRSASEEARPLLHSAQGSAAVATNAASADEGASAGAAMANLLKSYLGTGLLAIPFAARCSGLWTAVIGLAVLAFFSNHTMKLLVTMKVRARVRMPGQNMPAIPARALTRRPYARLTLTVPLAAVL